MTDVNFKFKTKRLSPFLVEILEHHDSGETFLCQNPNGTFRMVNGVEQIIVYASTAADAIERFKKTQRYLGLLTYGADVKVSPVYHLHK